MTAKAADPFKHGERNIMHPLLKNVFPKDHVGPKLYYPAVSSVWSNRCVTSGP
jgi:hypothetical protein